jgi:UDPglucose--hexose-1-phosphate uridylyltransferase
LNDMTKSHARRNLLTGEWVLVSPRRLDRPWHGLVDDPDAGSQPAHDPDCALCPGNERANGARNADYAGPFVFDNDFPALDIDSEAATPSHPLLERRPETGRCRVICYSDRHDLRFATMDAASRIRALDAMFRQFAELDRESGIAYVTLFENRGRMMGCSNPHPHAQVWATSSVPTEAVKESVTQADYFERHGRPLLLDYAASEAEDGSRVVLSEPHWLAVVPYWATWPYELLLLPTRALQAPDELDAAEVAALAATLGGALEALETLFRAAVPYSMGFHPRPSDGGDHRGWQFHLHVYPPLLRSAAVRKHLVGFEMLAQPQRDLTPEDAAANLRRAMVGSG